jgi:hypothetical protein
MYQLDDIRANYQRMSREQLLVLAIRGAADLTPEALDLLRVELRARGLEAPTEEAIRVQLAPPTEGERQGLLERFRRLPCPTCGQATSLLNAFSITHAQFFLFQTAFRSQVLVGCGPCLSTAATRANKTLLKFGWWQLPLGPFWSLRAFLANRRALNLRLHVAPTPELQTFVAENLGDVALRLNEGAA